MYRGFKITKETILKILENKVSYKDKYEDEAEKIKTVIKNNLDEYLLPNNKMDVAKLRDDWFPTDQYDVFISHSHRDIEEIKVLAGYLISAKGLKVFVDSFIWEYFEDLQKKLDDKYNLEENNSYNYKGSNWCCNNVSIILNSALQEVIDKSEAIFFYNTPNSITHNYKDQNRTESPWIFSEIETTRIIRKKLPIRLQPGLESHIIFEKRNDAKAEAEFSYWIESTHLTSLDKTTFDKWIEEDINNDLKIFPVPDDKSLKMKGENELNKLYLMTKDEKRG